VGSRRGLLRLVGALPEVLQVHVEGAVHPVLPLFEVERAHPVLADVLARLRTRGRTVRA
jgi:hypothetical protein